MKILLIEDELELSNFLIRGLNKEGYDVDHLEDGQKVMSQLSKHKYDVMILDLLLPKISGEEVLKEMRINKNFMPVIVLTAVDDVETKTKILNMGADDYLVKPFSFVELTARIKSVLRRSQGGMQPPQPIKVGDLVLDPEMRMVTRAGKAIKLRLKEYVLLEFFMQNVNKVVSRSMLIEKIWDYNAQLYSNTVDSHISSLRKKINAGYEKKLIETVHGVGYILKTK